MGIYKIKIRVSIRTEYKEMDEIEQSNSSGIYKKFNRYQGILAWNDVRSSLG